MQKMLTLILLLLCGLLLSGCLSFSADYQDYATALSTHSAAESARISAQAEAIAEAAQVPGITQTEAVLLSAIAMMQIERLQAVPLGISAPITGYHVLNTVAGHIPFFSNTWGLVRLGEKAIENAGNVVFDAETIDVADSFNRTETHATGDSNTAGSYADRDNSTTTTTTTTTNEPPLEF